MHRKQHLEQLIRALVESINGSIRRSGQIRDIMQQIESQGYEIHISLLAGIILHDREGGEADLNELFEGRQFLDADQLSEIEQQFFAAATSEDGLFTESDRRFLLSLGIIPED